MSNPQRAIRGVIKRGYENRARQMVWEVTWQHGHGPLTVVSDGDYREGQTVWLTGDGTLSANSGQQYTFR